MKSYTITQNLSRGRWAVAITGYRDWNRSFAMGDGITIASSSLVTRCETREEAERIAAALNAEQPHVMPGGRGAWDHEVMPYRKTDYLSSQDRRNGDRDCDRRICSL